MEGESQVVDPDVHRGFKSLTLAQESALDLQATPIRFKGLRTFRPCAPKSLLIVI
jgi:hypothetical protein